MDRRRALKIFIAAIVARLGLDAMTNPLSVAQDNPDWGRQSAGSNIDLLNVHKTVNATENSSVLQTGNMNYMFVRAVSTQATNIQILWFSDLAGSRSLLKDEIVVNTTATDAAVCIPVRGAYVKFVITPQIFPATIDVDAFITPERFNVNVQGGGGNVLISSDRVAIGAGATTTINATKVRAGHIFFGCDVGGGTSWIAELYALDVTGAAQLIDFLSDKSDRRGHICYAPAQPLQLVVRNFEGTARDVTAVVTHHPHLN